MREKYNIEKARKIFENHGLILDEKTYINSTTKMKCYDDFGYYYETTLANILSNRQPMIVNARNPYSIQNIQKFLENNNSKTKLLSTEYINNKKMLEFKCECGEKYKTSWGETNHGKVFCNFCMKSKRYDNLRDYTTLLNEECIRRNYTLISEHISRSFEPFEYVCNIHKDKGIQTSYFDRFYNAGQGCYWCGIDKRGAARRIDEEKLEKIADEKGFIYVGVDYNERNNGAKKATLHLICKRHKDKGIQYIDLHNLRANTSGCIYCNGQGRTKESLQEEIDNLGLNIDILVFNSYTDIVVRCRNCGLEWNTSGINLTQGHACPMCKKSKNEVKVKNFLSRFEYNYIPQYYFSDCKDIVVLKFDFYLPDFNILIEVDGEQHSYPVSFHNTSEEKKQEMFETVVRHDNIKNDYCFKNNIPLIRLSYEEFETGDWEYILFDALKIYNAVA